MRITIIAVGKAKELGFQQLLEDYVTRIRRYVPCDQLEIKDNKQTEQTILAAVSADVHVVALEKGGEKLSSEQFAAFLQAKGTENKGEIAFIIGPANGLSRAVVRRADTLLSLSSFTLAHRVARLVLTEQLYRAVTIWKKMPYHRA